MIQPFAEFLQLFYSIFAVNTKRGNMYYTTMYMLYGMLFDPGSNNAQIKLHRSVSHCRHCSPPPRPTSSNISNNISQINHSICNLLPEIFVCGIHHDGLSKIAPFLLGFSIHLAAWWRMWWICVCEFICGVWVYIVCDSQSLETNR